MTPRGLTTEEGMNLLRSSERSIFRLETLDRYALSAEDENYVRWTRGEPPPPIDGLPWFELIRKATTAGKQWERVHMIRLPLTDYLRFECEYGYKRNELAGERCFILEVAGGDPLPVPAVDFWLLDDAQAIRMDYDPEGHVLGRMLMTDPATVAEFRRRRDVALSLATPFPEWFRQAHGAGHI